MSLRISLLNPIPTKLKMSHPILHCPLCLFENLLHQLHLCCICLFCSQIASLGYIHICRITDSRNNNKPKYIRSKTLDNISTTRWVDWWIIELPFWWISLVIIIYTTSLPLVLQEPSTGCTPVTSPPICWGTLTVANHSRNGVVCVKWYICVGSTY